MGPLDKLTAEPDFNLVHTVLPLSVERGKPRTCIDGGGPKAISPDKIDCVLDEISGAIRLSRKDCYFCKYDDRQA